MASTSLTLGAHWEEFIEREVASGRYASASDVMRAALRELEERNQRLAALRAHLADGAAQAARGEGIRNLASKDIIERAKARRRT